MTFPPTIFIWHTSSKMNHLSKLAMVLLAGIILFSSPVGALPQPNAPIMPFKDIQKGMKGVGYTTFSGIEPEPFDVEIIGFNYNMNGPGQHIIIALLTGKKIEFTSTIAGMSGSPVYIDGKLVGAVSLALSKFPKEVLVGITPFESMLKAGQSHGGVLAIPHVADDKLAAVGAQYIPLLQTEPLINKTTANKNFLLDSKERTSAITKLIPGGPISTFLATGDVELAATGTITDIRDGIVYAFGHSFNGQGHVEVPFGSAEIVWVVANQELSYKMANAGPVLGTIYEDRSPAVVGKIGAKPDMLPVTVHFVRPEGAEDYHFSIVRDNQETAGNLLKILQHILTAQIDYNRGGTLRFDSSLKLTGHDPLYFHDMVAMEQNTSFLGIEITPYMLAANRTAKYFNALCNPPIGHMRVENLEYTFVYSPEIDELTFENLEIKEYRLRPGSTLKGMATFRKNSGDRLTREVTLAIPPDARKGEYTLIVGAAAKTKDKDVTFTNYESYYRFLKTVRPDGQLYLQLIGKGVVTDVGMNVHYNLPPTFAMLATGENTAQLGNETIIREERIPFDYVINGQASAKIIIY